MRIENLRCRRHGGEQSLCATIIWENSNRAPFEMHFTIPDSADIALDCVAEPFLLACCTRAIDRGEERIWCADPVSPGLIDDIHSALSIVLHWGRHIFPHTRIPSIQIPTREYSQPKATANAAFYSGGVDSTHLLLKNYIDHGSETAGRITHAIAVYGLDMGKRPESNQEFVFNHFLQTSKPFLDSLNIKIVPLITNLRHLDERLRFFPELSAGFDLAACSMVFSSQFRTVQLATAGERLSDTVQVPMSLNPIIPLYLQSAFMQIRSPYVEISRFDRLRLIARNKTAVSALRVCFFSDDQALNCGKCEKCIRTMLALHLLNSDASAVFPRSLQASDIDQISIESETVAAFHEEILNQLKSSSSHELLNAEKNLMRRWQNRKAKERTIKLLKMTAKAFLPDGVLRLIRAIRS